MGIIGLPATNKDLEALKPILHNSFGKEPNLVLHIYKVRRGKISRCKLWQYVDLGTCRTIDLFLTNNDYQLIEIEGTKIEKILDDNEIRIQDIEDTEEDTDNPPQAQEFVF